MKKRKFFIILCFFVAFANEYIAFAEKPAAILKKYTNKVKIKSRNSIMWTDVKKNMGLYEDDRIRTMEKSSAIAFYNDKTNIMIKENSLIVVKQMDTSENVKRADIELKHGSVSGKVESNPEEDVVMVISSTPFDSEATVEIDSRKGGNKTDFEIEIQHNKDISVHVKKGMARITSNGETVELRDNQSTIIEPNSAPTTPWAGKKRPFNRVVLLCIIFIGVFVVISGLIVFINKKEVIR